MKGNFSKSLFTIILVALCNKLTYGQIRITREFLFKNIGSYSGVLNGFSYKKTFYLPRIPSFKAEWVQAGIVCKNYGMELASFTTIEEATAFFKYLDSSRDIPSTGGKWLHVDGITFTPKSPTEWYWTKSTDPVAFDMTWNSGMPNNYQEDEFCLSVGRKIANEPLGFNDMHCSGPLSSASFVCQLVA